MWSQVLGCCAKTLKVESCSEALARKMRKCRRKIAGHRVRIYCLNSRCFSLSDSYVDTSVFTYRSGFKRTGLAMRVAYLVTVSLFDVDDVD